jgi:hypothetical protein
MKTNTGTSQFNNNDNLGNRNTKDDTKHIIWPPTDCRPYGNITQHTLRQKTQKKISRGKRKILCKVATKKEKKNKSTEVKQNVEDPAEDTGLEENPK